MGKVALFLGIACFALLLLLTAQFSQLKVAQSKLADAEKLGLVTRDLLRSIGQPCNQRAENFAGITSCITPLLDADMFEVSDFQNFDTRDNSTGAFIITNDGARTYNGSKFVLQKNGIEVMRGCHIPTEILPEYSCRFPIKAECEPGDVLAVIYRDETPIRVLTKTC